MKVILLLIILQYHFTLISMKAILLLIILQYHFTSISAKTQFHVSVDFTVSFYMDFNENTILLVIILQYHFTSISMKTQFHMSPLISQYHLSWISMKTQFYLSSFYMDFNENSNLIFQQKSFRRFCHVSFCQSPAAFVEFLKADFVVTLLIAGRQCHRGICNCLSQDARVNGG